MSKHKGCQNIGCLNKITKTLFDLRNIISHDSLNNKNIELRIRKGMSYISQIMLIFLKIERRFN